MKKSSSKSTLGTRKPLSLKRRETTKTCKVLCLRLNRADRWLQQLPRVTLMTWSLRDLTCPEQADRDPTMASRSHQRGNRTKNLLSPSRSKTNQSSLIQTSRRKTSGQLSKNSTQFFTSRSKSSLLLERLRERGSWKRSSTSRPRSKSRRRWLLKPKTNSMMKLKRPILNSLRIEKRKSSASFKTKSCKIKFLETHSWGRWSTSEERTPERILSKRSSRSRDSRTRWKGRESSS